jgi:hypothetical protein
MSLILLIVGHGLRLKVADVRSSECVSTVSPLGFGVPILLPESNSGRMHGDRLDG